MILTPRLLREDGKFFLIFGAESIYWDAGTMLMADRRSELFVNSGFVAVVVVVVEVESKEDNKSCIFGSNSSLCFLFNLLKPDLEMLDLSFELVNLVRKVERFCSSFSFFVALS